MKIEKGKLYTYDGVLEKCMSDGVVDDGLYSNKIAVHCYTERDWEYVKSKGYELRRFIGSGIYSLAGVSYYDFKHCDIIIDQFKEFYAESDKGIESTVISDKTNDNVVINNQKHYDNSNGSLFQLAEKLGLNHWEFDILKRLVRCRKKGQFAEDLRKIKDTCDIYLHESK